MPTQDRSDPIIPVRVKVWLPGLVVAGLMVLFLRNKIETRDLSFPAGVVAVAVTASIAEVLSIRRRSQAHNRLPVSFDQRPADGIVELAPVRGSERLGCSSHPDLSRFVRLQRSEPAPIRPEPGPMPLLGRVVLISVFVGRDGTSWSDPEIAGGHEALFRAGEWIERQAIQAQVALNVSLADVYFQFDDDEVDQVEVAFWPEGDDVGPLEARASMKAVVMASRAAARLGFADAADWFGRIQGLIDADRTIWLFHLRQAGRSIAITHDISEVPGVGFAACYAREASFPEPLKNKARIDPTTVVHELLHLCGASDKYGVALRSFPRGSVDSRDIMRLNHDSLSRMTIGQLTASEIGWNVSPSKPSSKKTPVGNPFPGRRRV